MSFEELKVTRFFTTLVIATLLFSVTISNFNFNVYAVDDRVEKLDEEKKELKKQYAEIKNEFREKLKQLNYSKIKKQGNIALNLELLSEMGIIRTELYELHKQFREQIKELLINQHMQLKELNETNFGNYLKQN